MTTAAPTRVLLLAAVVLGVVLGLPGPAAAFGVREGTDPVGVWPLTPMPDVVAAFDPPDSPYGAGHRGVDLAGSPGQPVRAALPGTVTFAGSLAGRGVAVVDHGATRTTYEPVAATVGVGDHVGSGDRIGTLQLVGSHCFPHPCLHWGWIQGETYLDPLRLVGAGAVRLLPLWRDEPFETARPSPPQEPPVGVGPGSPVTAWTPPANPYAGWRTLLRLLHLVGAA